MELTIYNRKGEKSGALDLPEKVFGQKPNSILVHQAIVTEEANLRTPIAHAKNRGEVRGGGKKPWKQKGTGRARHGSTRSPIWVGGGVAHGPTNEKILEKKLNRKMRNKALATILSGKAKEGEVILIDSIAMSTPKTKEAVSILQALSKTLSAKQLTYKSGRRVLLVTPTRNPGVEKSFGNIGGAETIEVRNLSALPALKYKYLIFVEPQACIDALSKRMTNQ